MIFNGFLDFTAGFLNFKIGLFGFSGGSEKLPGTTFGGIAMILNKFLTYLGWFLVVFRLILDSMKFLRYRWNMGIRFWGEFPIVG